jgi:soluble epoxide hydrolase / lipid-phosphate phosphatase
MLTISRIKNTRIDTPSLFIAALNDPVLKPEMALRQGKSFDNLTSKEVTATHWALTEAPDEVNAHLKDWFNTHVFTASSSL